MRILIVPMAALAENAAVIGKKLSEAGGINTIIGNISWENKEEFNRVCGRDHDF